MLLGTSFHRKAGFIGFFFLWPSRNMSMHQKYKNRLPIAELNYYHPPNKTKCSLLVTRCPESEGSKFVWKYLELY